MEAFHAKLTLDALVLVVRKLAGTEGAITSTTGASVVTLITLLAPEILPAASLAFTVNEYAVLGVKPLIVVLVPVTVVEVEPYETI